MSDQAPGPSLEERTTTALESIAFALNQLVLRVPLPAPRLVDRPAHEAYLSGTWKRRPGNIVPAPTQAQLHTGSPPIGTQLDPWVRRDRPVMDGTIPTRQTPVDS